MITMLVVVIAGVGGLMWFISNQDQATQDTRTIISEAASTGLKGKPATITVKAVDKANDDTQIAANGYICTNPTVTDTSIVCGFQDSKVLSSTATTDFTSGLVVGDKYVGLASNNTYFGFPTVVKDILTQADPLTLETYSTTSDMFFELKTAGDAIITASGGTQNLTLSASEGEILGQVKLQQNVTNTAVNLAGFYFDKATNGNMTKVEEAGDVAAKIPSGTTGFAATTGVSLTATEAEDVVFLFDTPVILKEYDSVTIEDGIKLTADSDGCTAGGENVVIYSLDKIWTLSSKDTNKFVYSYESDAATPADVGLADQSFTFSCTA